MEHTNQIGQIQCGTVFMSPVVDHSKSTKFIRIIRLGERDIPLIKSKRRGFLIELERPRLQNLPQLPLLEILVTFESEIHKGKLDLPFNDEHIRY